MRDIIDEAIEAVAVGGRSYTIGNRTYTRDSIRALKELRSYYAQLAARDADSTGGQELATFGDPQ